VAGEQFVVLARNSLQELESGIAEIRQQQQLESASIRFTMQHAAAKRTATTNLRSCVVWAEVVGASIYQQIPVSQQVSQ
jgi:hypothetical protein